MRLALIAGVLVAVAGCGDDGVVAGEGATGPATAVTVELGSVDATSSSLDVAVRLSPADARLEATPSRGARATVAEGTDGRATLRLRGLRLGATAVRLRATATGARAWTGTASITRRAPAPR